MFFHLGPTRPGQFATHVGFNIVDSQTILCLNFRVGSLRFYKRSFQDPRHITQSDEILFKFRIQSALLKIHQFLFAQFVCDKEECIDRARDERGGPGGHLLERARHAKGHAGAMDFDEEMD